MLQRYEPPQMPVILDGSIAHGAMDDEEYFHFKSGLACWRDVLIAKLLKATGLRVMEFLRLEARHYSVTGPEFFILVKRSKKRAIKTKDEYERIFLPPSLGVEIRDYIKGNNFGSSDRVFPITDRALRYAFEKAGLKTIGRAVTPHEMRHLYVKTLIDGGVPVIAAAKLVGHSDPKTTSEWYYDLTTEQRRAIGERMPV